MNTFIILIPEEYDCYTVDVPYPIVTSLTFEQMQDILNDIAIQSAEHENTKSIGWKTFKFGKLNILSYQSVKYDTQTRYSPQPIQLLKLDEWIEKYNIWTEQ